MPWIDTWGQYANVLQPQPNETYQAFVTRCTPALTTLLGSTDPDMDGDNDVQEAIDAAWASYIMDTATEVTVKLKRNIEMYQNSVYLEAYMGDWEVAEILSATTGTITFASVEKARAVTGDKFKIAKSKDDEQLVFGWANIAIDADGNFPLDWDGDITDPVDLEKAAYNFVLKYRATGEQHEGEVKGQLVESVMFTKQKQEAMGIPDGVVPEGWWVGFHVPDTEVFAKIKSGEYEMFSVEGTAQRVPTGQ